MPETVGIYYRDDEVDELNAFDEVASRHQEGYSYSRSQAVREAMKLYETVLTTMERHGYPTNMPMRQREHAVRQALIDFEQE